MESVLDVVLRYSASLKSIFEYKHFKYNDGELLCTEDLNIK